MNNDEIILHNQKAWDKSVEDGICWSLICSEEEIVDAQKACPRIILSPSKSVPPSWLGDVKGKKILGLAAGGGQQAPILAAAGADFTTFDLSENQLKQDQIAADKFGLKLTTVQGRADDLSLFSNETFDMIINPCSNCFFPDLKPVWRECARVLKPGGRIMYCFTNPIAYLFDFAKANLGEFELKYSLPYSDQTSLSDEEKTRFLREETQFEFGHSLSDQMGELLKHGFKIIDMYEDVWGEKFKEPIDKHFPQFINILAEKNL